MGTDKRARQKELHRTRAEQARKEAASAARRKRLVNIVLATVSAVALVGLIMFITDDDDTTTANNSSDKTTTTAADKNATTTVALGTTDCPKADGSSERLTTFDGPPKMCIDEAKTYTAKVDTSMGAFTIALDAAKAPATVNNFVFLSRYGFYNTLTFHRIIAGFMFQGGDPEGTGSGGPGYSFQDELPNQGDYKMYSVAMANSGPDTNGSQFFVITGEQGVALPPSYSLFGQVTEGTDVADAIGKVQTGESDKPLTPVTITKVTITES